MRAVEIGARDPPAGHCITRRIGCREPWRTTGSGTHGDLDARAGRRVRTSVLAEVEAGAERMELFASFPGPWISNNYWKKESLDCPFGLYAGGLAGLPSPAFVLAALTRIRRYLSVTRVIRR